MANLVQCVTFHLIFIVIAVSGWKAVPANQAMYSLRSASYGPTEGLLEDEELPRLTIHSIYKFGWCTPDSIQKVFLRKSANITLTDWHSSRTRYIYLLEDGGTIEDTLACIVMTIYVPYKHLFRTSRIPMYYCQGYVYLMYKLTYTRLDIHEFYLHTSLDLLLNIHFDFYHPQRL